MYICAHERCAVAPAIKAASRWCIHIKRYVDTAHTHLRLFQGSFTLLSAPLSAHCLHTVCTLSARNLHLIAIHTLST